MEEITFRLRTVTPLFMSGADQNEAELRPPSIKGTLRFWYRAMVGEEGLQKEKEIFGSTETGQGSFLIRIAKPPSIKNDRKEVGQGIGYMGYGPVGRNLRKVVFQRSYIDANESFEVLIALRNSAYKEDILKSFWLLVNFGGLGARSRRGFGSIQVEEVSGDTQGISFIGDVKTASDQAIYLNNGLKVIFDEIKPSAQPIPKYSAFSRETKIWVYEINKTGWQSSMENVGQKFQRYRSNRVSSGQNMPFPNDYKTVHDYMDEGTISRCPERAIFGLPHNYFSSRRRRNKEKIFQSSFTGERHERRASPLIFHFFELKEGMVGTIITYLKSAFLCGNEQIKAVNIRKKNRINEQLINIPDYQPIENFISCLIPKPIEVTIP